MNKEQLFDLTERVKLVAGVELPVIVGSQSLYGVTPHVPDIVKRSVECDWMRCKDYFQVQKLFECLPLTGDPEQRSDELRLTSRITSR